MTTSVHDQRSVSGMERVPGEIFAAIVAFCGFDEFVCMLGVSNFVRRLVVWDCTTLAWNSEVQMTVEKGAGAGGGTGAG